MASESAAIVLALLGRVLEDALSHECEAVVVHNTQAGVRFKSELGATLAFVAAGTVAWVEVAGVIRRMMDDAVQQGYPQCVVEDDVERRITLNLTGENARYFRGNVDAIVRRLGG